MFCSLSEFDTKQGWDQDIAVVLYVTTGHKLLINNDVLARFVVKLDWYNDLYRAVEQKCAVSLEKYWQNVIFTKWWRMEHFSPSKKEFNAPLNVPDVVLSLVQYIVVF